ncbi:cyclin-J18-like isoform X2 [Typha angustifolia]|uniref:cyclin-J18-like isoform X2 n=1 Tax=Typha angustifolia TaxID=59011 RepID=UPI003C30BA7A
MPYINIHSQRIFPPKEQSERWGWRFGPPAPCPRLRACDISCWSSCYMPPYNSSFVPSSSTPRSPSSLIDSSPRFKKGSLLGRRRDCRLADSWLLRPMRASNLQLFALVSIWISSKIHDSGPLSVKSLKSLGDKLISDQHFTSRDFVQAVLAYDIGASSIPFVYLEDLYIQFRELSKIADLMNFDVCMEVMDLLYETEETSVFFNSPYSLAASTLITAYVISVPKQRWEFPILPWVKFVTSYDEEEIGEIVMNILMHVLQPEGIKKKTN